jgi:hypothetical protein
MRFEWGANSSETTNQDLLRGFAGNTLFLPQFFISEYNNNNPFNVNQVEGISKDMPMSLGLSPLLVMFFCLLFALQGTASKRAKKREAFFFVAIVILIFAASTLFPWESFGLLIPPTAFFVRIFQFPWRGNTLVVLFAGALLCSTASKLTETMRRYILIIVAVVAVGQAVDFNSKLLAEKDPAVFYPEALVRYLYFPDYLPAGANPDDYVNALTLGQSTEIFETSRYYNSVKVSVANSSSASDFLEIPLINYPGYRAVDVNSGTQLNISDGRSKRVRVEIPGDYSGVFTVRFVSPWYWRLAEAISVATALFLLCWYFRGILRPRQPAHGER